MYCIIIKNIDVILKNINVIIKIIIVGDVYEIKSPKAKENHCKANQTYC